MESYYDSAEGITITKKRALKELRDHGVTNPAEFYSDCGERDLYDAQEVLAWLGH